MTARLHSVVSLNKIFISGVYVGEAVIPEDLSSCTFFCSLLEVYSHNLVPSIWHTFFLTVLFFSFPTSCYKSLFFSFEFNLS